MTEPQTDFALSAAKELEYDLSDVIEDPIHFFTAHREEAFQQRYGLDYSPENTFRSLRHGIDATEPAVTARKRILCEISALERQGGGLPLITVSADEDSILDWTATIEGPPDSPYEDGIFALEISLPPDYPLHPPRVRFVTKIYHPNIDSDGRVSCDLLGTSWCLALSVGKLLLSIQSMLCDPELIQPLVPEVAHVYMTDRETYERTARQWTREFAELKPESRAAEELAREDEAIVLVESKENAESVMKRVDEGVDTVEGKEPEEGLDDWVEVEERMFRLDLE